MTIYNYSINNDINLKNFIENTKFIFIKINTNNILNNKIFINFINLIICIICKYKDGSIISIIQNFINGNITINEFL
jgi:hypothetical protein